MEESRAAQELKNLGEIKSKGGSLKILVKPSPPPKGSRESDVEPSAAGYQRPTFSQSAMRRNDGDVLMDEDPTAVVTVRKATHSIWVPHIHTHSVGVHTEYLINMECNECGIDENYTSFPPYSKCWGRGLTLSRMLSF